MIPSRSTSSRPEKRITLIQSRRPRRSRRSRHPSQPSVSPCATRMWTRNKGTCITTRSHPLKRLSHRCQAGRGGRLAPVTATLRHPAREERANVSAPRAEAARLSKTLRHKMARARKVRCMPQRIRPRLAPTVLGTSPHTQPTCPDDHYDMEC